MGAQRVCGEERQHITARHRGPVAIKEEPMKTDTNPHTSTEWPTTQPEWCLVPKPRHYDMKKCEVGSRIRETHPKESSEVTGGAHGGWPAGDRESIGPRRKRLIGNTSDPRKQQSPTVGLTCMAQGRREASAAVRSRQPARGPLLMAHIGSNGQTLTKTTRC